jgi:hypothetical protein
MRHLKRATKSIVMFVYQRLRLEERGGLGRRRVVFVYVYVTVGTQGYSVHTHSLLVPLHKPAIP